mmetsp:Transcript_12911/g.27425  ORF Transcript_12911/g.27425 Transcript_12911/m.27425 type:complete len:87 (-) Transcript_12911:324-584(-)
MPWMVTLPNFAMKRVSHDQMNFSRISYIHGGFVGAAPDTTSAAFVCSQYRLQDEYTMGSNRFEGGDEIQAKIKERKQQRSDENGCS